MGPSGTLPRLSLRTLAGAPAHIVRPSYERGQVSPGIVHLGIGAFHRAHQAAVFEAALNTGDLRWGITGVSLRSPSVQDQLIPQDGLYTLVVRDGAETSLQVIGAVQQVLVAPRDPARVISALADPRTHIVTLTVTEKGYCLDRATNELNAADEDVASDLKSLEAPRTAIGYLVAGLSQRRRSGLPPFTAVSCDNLPENGVLLRQAVLAMATAHDRSLADWIAEQGAFPSTMVDRIVPATTAEDIDSLRQSSGFEDQGMVKTEPFTQWVIEDRFAGERPDFASLGVQLADDVTPWEVAKLRMLNGAHSAMAYIGGLAGIAFIHDFVARDEGAAFVNALWDESEATLEAADGLDIPSYRRALMQRFSNSALQHRTFQIAQDGSLKLPQRLIQPLAARATAGLQSPLLTLAVAAWVRWQAGVDDKGKTHLVDDPAAPALAELLSACQDAAERIDAMLTYSPVFPESLRVGAFRDPLIEALRAIEEEGAWPALLGALKGRA